MPSTITYRDHYITRLEGFEPFDFEYEHKDFDGIDDSRAGWHNTIQECKEAIDEWHLEQGENDEYARKMGN